MKLEVFNKKIKRLEGAFRVPPLTESSYGIYWEKLKDIPDKDFEEEVELVIETEDRFPSIHRLRQFKGQDHRPASKAACAVCGSTTWTCYIGKVCIDCFKEGKYGD